MCVCTRVLICLQICIHIPVRSEVALFTPPTFEPGRVWPVPRRLKAVPGGAPPGAPIERLRREFPPPVMAAGEGVCTRSSLHYRVRCIAFRLFIARKVNQRASPVPGPGNVPNCPFCPVLGLSGWEMIEPLAPLANPPPAKEPREEGLSMFPAD
jgi:hypothetical protein